MIQRQFFKKAETKQSTRKHLIDNSMNLLIVLKKLCPGSSSTSTDTTEDNDTSSATSSSKIWESFTELLEEFGAKSDTYGGVEAMVNEYLSEPLIDYESDDPLKWWNENKC